MPIDKFSRYQTKLVMSEMYPTKIDGTCRCGCGRKIEPPRRIWHGTECYNNALNNYSVIRGDVNTIRKLLQERDDGICSNCKKKLSSWQADHIIEVRDGGGGCGLDNFQTLCLKCHKKKTHSR